MAWAILSNLKTQQGESPSWQVPQNLQETKWQPQRASGSHSGGLKSAAKMLWAALIPTVSDNENSTRESTPSEQMCLHTEVPTTPTRLRATAHRSPALFCQPYRKSGRKPHNAVALSDGGILGCGGSYAYETLAFTLSKTPLQFTFYYAEIKFLSNSTNLPHIIIIIIFPCHFCDKEVREE